MKYKTCVSIAETTPNRIKQAAKKALKNSDYIELRLDFLKPENIPQTLELLKKELRRSVCTLRPKSEGGKFSGTEKERIAIIKLISEYSPFLLDVEFNSLKKNKSLVNYLKKTKTDILVSWHDFKKTPSTSELNNRLNLMSRFSNYIKIVTNAKSVKDPAHVLALYARVSKIKLIAFAMGDYGKISRILSLYLGSPFTYVSLGKPIAPGQFSLSEVKEIVSNN